MKAKQSAFILLTTASLFYLVASYSANVWLGRHLGPHDYGSYSLIISIITIVNLVQTAGIPQSASRFIAKDSKHEKEILSNALTLQLISAFLLSFAIFIFAKPIAKLLNDPDLTHLIQISALIFPAYGIYSLFYGYFNGLHYFKQQAVINMLYSFGKAAGIISLSYFYGLKGAIIGFAVASIPSIVYIVDKIPRLSFRGVGKDIFRYSLPLIGSAAGLTLFLTLDLLFIKIILKDSSMAGYYSAAQNIAIIPYLSLSAFSTIIFPSISKKVHVGDTSGAKHAIETSFRFLLILIILLCALIIGTNNQLVTLFYGSEYKPAAQTLVWLTIAYAVLTVFAFFVSILNGSGKAKKSMIYAAAGIAVSIFCFILLIPKKQLIGAAIGTGAGAFLATILSFYKLRDVFNTTIPIKTFLTTLSVSILIIWISRIVKVQLVFLIPWYVLLIIISCCILYAFNIINKKDIKTLIPKRIAKE
jgi:O-antigen/teichoic acid export membrane protein